MSRDEAIKLVAKYDGNYDPSFLKVFVNILIFPFQRFGKLLIAMSILIYSLKLSLVSIVPSLKWV